MKKYHIYGKSFAGSLIVEFLFEETNTNYDITFLDQEKMKSPDFLEKNPQGKIPVLITPEDNVIFESLAIITHITEKNSSLIPEPNTLLRDKYWQYLSMLAAVMYPAYHRQHHSYQYVNESGYDEIRERSRILQSKLYDHIENILNPYFCESRITAVDYYFYMMSRWDLNKEKMKENRPKISSLLEKIRKKPSVDKVLKSQPRKKII